LPLALRTPEGQKLNEELLKFKEDKEKLRETYYKEREYQNQEKLKN
jgi:hypothetical protein